MYFCSSPPPVCCSPLSLSCLSLCSPDTLAQACETSPDVSADIQKLIPDQGAEEEGRESRAAGCVLLCPADPGPGQHMNRSRPSQSTQGELQAMDCTTREWEISHFFFSFFSHIGNVFILKVFFFGTVVVHLYSLVCFSFNRNFSESKMPKISSTSNENVGERVNKVVEKRPEIFTYWQPLISGVLSSVFPA